MNGGRGVRVCGSEKGELGQSKRERTGESEKVSECLGGRQIRRNQNNIYGKRVQETYASMNTLVPTPSLLRSPT